LFVNVSKLCRKPALNGEGGDEARWVTASKHFPFEKSI